MTISGDAGDNNLHGTGADDDFDMSQGGQDTVQGRGGDDVIDFGDTFDANDHVFGGAGFDTLKLSGGHNIGEFVTLDSIEKIVVADGFTYGFQFSSTTIAPGHTLTVDASALSLGDQLNLQDQGEDGRLVVKGGAGGDTMFTGAGDDVIYGGDGADTINPGNGKDWVNAGAGEDDILFTGAGKLDAADHIDGGDPGANTLTLIGDYSSGIVFEPGTIKHITGITLFSGFDYSLTLGHATLGFGLIVDGHQLGASDTMHIDGTGQPSGTQLTLKGGAGDDVLIGGGGYDTLVGGLGADHLTGKGGPDAFTYNAAGESTGSHYDTVIGFDAHDDFIFPGFTVNPSTVSGFDGTVNHGKLSAMHFNMQLADAVGAGQLGADHAVLFQPDSGGLAGTLFLIVDGNNTAGYQAGQDLVVLFQSPHHMDDFDITNFGNAG